MSDTNLPSTSISLAAGFRFAEVPPSLRVVGPTTPDLGPLAAFTGNWTGHGFNTIFRPDNAKSASSSSLPKPLPPGDNILELNLTSEDLAFSPSLGSVPNRGTSPQSDIFLNGVPYLQSVSDITSGQPIGIHVEPGLWMIVPPTTVPPIPQSTLVRMASIPHGTTIEAQGTWSTIAGPPNIPPVSITPFGINNPGSKFPFPSQTAANSATARIPQDLTSFIANGTITQAMLDDPNTVLRNIISKQKIIATTTLSIATNPAPPLFGGGTDNIAFLAGSPAAVPPPNNPNSQNAQSVQMAATFWIETVQQTITIPIFRPGQPPLTIKGQSSVPSQPVPTFIVAPPIEITKPRQITFQTTQIQYSQFVLLNFNGISWPHVSVATLVPTASIAIPPSAWD